MTGFGAKKGVEEIENNGNGNVGFVGLSNSVDQSPIVCHTLVSEHPVHDRTQTRFSARTFFQGPNPTRLNRHRRRCGCHCSTKRFDSTSLGGNFNCSVCGFKLTYVVPTSVWHVYSTIYYIVCRWIWAQFKAGSSRPKLNYSIFLTERKEKKN